MAIHRSPEEYLVREIYMKKDTVDEATAAAERAQQFLQQTQDERDEAIGAAETQLILMMDAPNISEQQKLEFTDWLLRATGQLQDGSPSAVDVFKQFTPGAPIIFVTGKYHLAQTVVSEAYASVRPAMKGKPGVDVAINCLTRGVNHNPSDNEQNPFYEAEHSFTTLNLHNVHVGIPAIQQHLDSLPDTVPQQKEQRQEYRRYLRTLKRAIDDLSTMGVKGTIEQLDTLRLDAQLALMIGLEIADFGIERSTQGRSGYGWWPRH